MTLSTVIFRLIWFANWVTPKRRQVIIHAFPDVEDSVVAILREIGVEKGNWPRVVLLVTGSISDAHMKLVALTGPVANRVRIVRKQSIAGVWSYITSSHVIFTHGIYGSFPGPDTQTVVNVWHGMPVKRIWLGLKGSTVPSCNWLLSTSQRYSDILSRASGLSLEKLLPIGLPRNDLLFRKGPNADAFLANIRADVARVVFVLPTYRKSRVGFKTLDGIEAAEFFGGDAQAISSLNRFLRETGTRLIVKPHPMSLRYGALDCSDPYFWIVNDEWLHRQGVTLYEAIAGCEALVTDVSSVYIDYLLTDKPMFIYFPDIQEYGESRTFLLNPIKEWLPGPLAMTLEQLISELRKWIEFGDKFQQRRAELRQVLNTQRNPDAAYTLLSTIA